jgi:phage-related protein
MNNTVFFNGGYLGLFESHWPVPITFNADGSVASTLDPVTGSIVDTVMTTPDFILSPLANFITWNVPAPTITSTVYQALAVPGQITSAVSNVTDTIKSVSNAANDYVTAPITNTVNTAISNTTSLVTSATSAAATTISNAATSVASLAASTVNSVTSLFKFW